MPKLIDYPRTTYAGAWELAEITDDTGGKCAIETAARKLNRKVSGSFKAIIGSAVKFGLITSKRDLLTTTTLFKRIKHAYDKKEELLFHREAFLTPPLFVQLCRKFRTRELPVQMLDVMLIREFGVEEINAQGVAKAFVEGCRMVGLLDERNIIADVDAISTQTGPRREIASPTPNPNTFREPGELRSAQLPGPAHITTNADLRTAGSAVAAADANMFAAVDAAPAANAASLPTNQEPQSDAIATLFGLTDATAEQTETFRTAQADGFQLVTISHDSENSALTKEPGPTPTQRYANATENGVGAYQLQVSGPGVNTTLSITDEEDLAIAVALLQKIRRQLTAK